MLTPDKTHGTPPTGDSTSKVLPDPARIELLVARRGGAHGPILPVGADSELFQPWARKRGQTITAASRSADSRIIDVSTSAVSACNVSQRQLSADAGTPRSAAPDDR